MTNEKVGKRIAQKQAFLERAVLAIIPTYVGRDCNSTISATVCLAAALTEAMYPPIIEEVKTEVEDTQVSVQNG